MLIGYLRGAYDDFRADMSRECYGIHRVGSFWGSAADRESL